MRFWRDLSVSRKLYSVIGLMACLIAIELLTLTFAMRSLTAVRAFVGGESQWSKAQKNAAVHLQRFATSRHESEYAAYLKELEVNLGDRAARIELGEPKPDMAIVRKGFVTGQVHPDDVDSLVFLLRYFSWEPHVAKALGSWIEADRLLDKFKATATGYHGLLTASATRSSAAKASADRIAELSGELAELNDQLTVAEGDFSATLSEGSRWLERTINGLLFAIVLTVESVGLTLTLLTSRAISRGLSSIQSAADQIGLGNFSKRAAVESKDEIGQLALAVNRMAGLLERTYGEMEERVHARTQDLARLASENEALYRQAADAVRMRDEFLSVASHELKTPLGALQLRLQLLRKHLDDPSRLERAREASTNSLRDAKRLNRLLEELLDLTRIRIGKFEIRRESGELASILLDACQQFSAEAAQAGSEITLEAPQPIQGRFDPVRVEQVVANLVSNAIKYGRGSPIHVSLRAKGGVAVIQIRDGGPGIAPDQVDRIFDRFERAGADEAVNGLGLGLYITRQIVEAHGGVIAVESEVGRGTTFTVRLPLVPAIEPDTLVPRGTPSPRPMA